jgi:hypothetical protein
MNVAVAELKESELTLREWMSPQDFKKLSEHYRQQVMSGKLFKSPGHQFLFEAWTACEFTGLIACDAVRLFDDRWPDFQTRTGNIIKGYEVAEVLEPGRTRGDENWNSDSVIPDPVEDWYKRAEMIPPALRDVVAKKVAKNYPPKKAALLIYLNIHEWGVRQTEIEADLHDATKLAKASFTDIWLLWKHKLYHLWKDGESATGVFQKQLTVADF